MRVKDYLLSIILNGFLGYLWTLFFMHISEIANSMENTLVVGGIVILIGSVLFFEIVRRVSPFQEYKKTHPINVVGTASFVGMMIVLYTTNWM
jgi:hypothetical protein